MGILKFCAFWNTMLKYRSWFYFHHRIIPLSISNDQVTLNVQIQQHVNTRSNPLLMQRDIVLVVHMWVNLSQKGATTRPTFGNLSPIILNRRPVIVSTIFKDDDDDDDDDDLHTIVIRIIQSSRSYLTVNNLIFGAVLSNYQVMLPCMVAKGYDDTCTGFYLRIQIATALFEHNQLPKQRSDTNPFLSSSAWQSCPDYYT